MDEITFHSRLHRPGTILDVGAHDGLLTLPFSQLPNSRVLAFEPLPCAFARLIAALTEAHWRRDAGPCGAAPRGPGLCEVIFELAGRWFPVAMLDRTAMQRAGPDPGVFKTSDPYVFVFYALPVEDAAAALASLAVA